MSALVTALVGLAGVLWLLEPAQPAWWGLPAWTWLPGGWWAGVSQVASGVVCLALVAWARVVLGPGRTPASALRSGELSEESRRSAA
ncbi:hypothetical protein [Nocardioides bruguierae]|uniref:Uncharacterized protein n=1 Tax=Nocardioides bruguierae TaxID=2945102 RepID=A0A9X2D7F2_9ACTN|nr:hypothetical protein [Nocardioides bruguierae]MCM0620607.1 hypothetical protein [Nocardioides bruguierae]